jgi:hypothetical protein
VYEDSMDVDCDEGEEKELLVFAVRRIPIKQRASVELVPLCRDDDVFASSSLAQQLFCS